MADEGLPVPSQEWFELATRVARIFVPHAGRQIDRLYPTRDHRARFVHYTSAEAALRIIQQKRLWMRNATCMVDYREVQHGYAYLLAAFAEGAAPGAAFIKALDACSPGVAKEAIDLFNQHWSDIALYTYITCTSEHLPAEDARGRLSMWRASSATVPRVAMVVSLPFFSGAAHSLGIFFSPVAYMDEGDVVAELQAITSNIETNREFLRGVDRQLLLGVTYQMLLSGVACLKHKAFEEEREWRAVYGPNRQRSNLMEESTETIHGVPQTVCKIPLDREKAPVLADLEFSKIFDRLIVGPTAYPAALCDAFTRELRAAGVQDAEQRVVPTDIPLRSSH